MALLLRNVCQFDFPGLWQTPLDTLLTAAACQDPTTGAQLAPERGLRALKALKQVLRGLQTKRFVADATAPGTREQPRREGAWRTFELVPAAAARAVAAGHHVMERAACKHWLAG